MSNFRPLEVVGRGSETQLQVAENLNKLGWQDESCVVCHSLIFPLEADIATIIASSQWIENTQVLGLYSRRVIIYYFTFGYWIVIEPEQFIHFNQRSNTFKP